MTEQSFSLVPFATANLPAITITGQVSLQANQLMVYYLLTGDISSVFLPVKSAVPQRKDELWKRTCFELFLAIKDQPAYWEFNFSPSGDWNVYRMGAYRRIDFHEESSIKQVRLEMNRESDALALNVTVDLSSIVQGEQSIETGITAVVQTKDGDVTYWALTHPGPRADFHNREGFILAPVGKDHPSKQSDLVD